MRGFFKSIWKQSVLGDATRETDAGPIPTQSAPFYHFVARASGFALFAFRVIQARAKRFQNPIALKGHFRRIVAMLLFWGLAALALAAPPREKYRPVDAYLTAWNDLQKIAKSERYRFRYFSVGHVEDLEEREDLLRVLSGHVNHLSRNQRIIPINWADRPAVVRVDITELRWPIKVFEHLVKTPEPYFHVVIVEDWPGGVWEKDKGGDGRYYEKRRWQYAAHAPQVTEGPGAVAATGLVKETQSEIPVIRADWFINQTTIQKGREGHGYYDFLGLGKQAKDWEKLIGADPASEDIFGEIGAVIPKSTRVAINNRQLRRRRALGVSDWFTIDVDSDVGFNNLVRNLDGIKQKQASERVGGLPNGMPAYWLEDGAGKRVDSVPDQFAGNLAAFSPDTRVHAGILTCLTCHEGGLHPIKDYVRDVLLGSDLPLQSPDRKKAEKLFDLYKTDLVKAFNRDVQAFEDAINEAAGMTQQVYSRAYGRQWVRYSEQKVTLARAAQEAGCDPEDITFALEKQRLINRPSDPLDLVLAAYLANPPVGIRREHFEEVFGLMMKTIKQYPRPRKE